MKFPLQCFFFLFLLGVFGCTVVAEGQRLPQAEKSFKEAANPEEKIIYVVSHGWHTGIVIPAGEIGSQLEFFDEYFDASQYYEVGWGDAGFYQAEKVTAGITLKAVLWPTPSVMHVVALPDVPMIHFPQSKIIKIKLSARGYENLLNAIERSFKKDKSGNPIMLKEGIYGESLFFEGAGKYYGIKTCNTWTARVLRKGGVPIRAFFNLTAGSTMKQLEKIAP